MDRAADQIFSDSLTALASPTRLALIRQLRTPKVLRDIQLRVTPDGPPLARQTVSRHLEFLMDAGLASSRAVEMPYGETFEFTVNHQRVFSLAEELRALARIAPTVEPGGATTPGALMSPLARKTACLVLVKGLDEGRCFDLAPVEAAVWTIGRRRGLAISVDFDPSTSSENARIRWDGRGHTIENVPGSRNGTTLDLRRLSDGERARLLNGAIVGVGRCLFVYRS